jgi:hypothetical protein
MLSLEAANINLRVLALDVLRGPCGGITIATFAVPAVCMFGSRDFGPCGLALTQIHQKTLGSAICG